MSMRLTVRAALLCSLLALVVGLTLGLMLGFLLSSKSDQGNDQLMTMLNKLNHDAWLEEPHIRQKILKDIDPGRIQDNLRILSKEPHLAGSERDQQLASYIRDRWLESGLDTADLVPYEVLLSYANPKKPNTVQLIDNGKAVFTSSSREKPLQPEDNHKDFIHGYHAYAPNGNVEGDLVFLNYGSDDDWAMLDDLNITASGKIIMLKEGFGSTGTKVKMAQEKGVLGVITYPDPVDVAAQGISPSDVYPETPFLPPSGIVRSSAVTAMGDPLTPAFPALDGVRRLLLKDAKLPQIPSQPISYEDAFQLLAWLDGKVVPKYWSGNLNLTYRTGPGFTKKNMKVRLKVHNQYRKVIINNVIGTIKGGVEPDRYVMLGNHRDAWGFGAVDPLSGTAMMLELIRVLGQLHRDGWRPRRTLVFCSWSAEEFALVGSTEWVEENLPQLQERAVAYINTDICVMGDKFTALASPSLKDALFHVTKLVPDPEGVEANLYDAWLESGKADDDEESFVKQEPHIDHLGPYSDFAPFIFYAGVPVVDLSWKSSYVNHTGSVYPTYHTGYETFYLMEKFYDPTFVRHRGCGRVAGLMMHYLADSSYLPLNVHRISVALRDTIEMYEAMNVKVDLEDRGLPFYKLEEAVSNFSAMALKWQDIKLETNPKNPMKVRILNDQLMAVERAFTSLPKQDGDNWFSRHRFYSSGSAILDLVSSLNYVEDDSEVEVMWADVERHLSEFIIAIHQATEMLRGHSHA